MNCFVTEAESAQEEVFLAVHQPMKLTRSYFGGNTDPVPQTEDDVLDALLVKRPPSGTLILPIVGDSGVGKSHMIRWLDARLKLLPDHKKRHIVRIPKSSSLKEVLRLILRELPGKKYDALRHKLDAAKTPPDRLEATRTLQTKLLVALEVAGNEAADRVRRGIAKPDDKARMAHCSKQALIALLLDPEIGGWFTSHEGEDEMKWGVLTRIADRCLHGSKRAGSGPAETEFLPEDFGFITRSDELNLALLSDSTRRYIPIVRRDVTDVIRFLNEVLETARSGLIDLGGVSLTELFIEIRKNLLEDGMELILLVEDFAVLAGIQGPLLDAMIREGIRDGKQELCIMRTALAVTEGRLSDETVRTRAQARWKIDSEPFASEEEAITTFENFVGGYLNAARWGVSQLSEMFRTRDDPENSSGWVQCFFDKYKDDMEDAERRQLLAFGFSNRGNHPLFPFNRGAIRQLARQYFYHRPTDSYRFDPRMLINRLLISTIRDNRTLWQRDGFPAPDFSDFRGNLLNPEVYLHVRSSLGELDTRRAAPLVYFWGDDPKSAGEAAALSDEIHDAFRIPRINWGAKPVPRAKAAPATSPGSAPVPSNDRADAWSKILEGWRINPPLGQQDSNKLRNYLSDAVSAWLDTNALLLTEVKSVPFIYLPKAKGNPELEKAVIIAATDEEFEDEELGPRFITAVQAVVRYHERKTWDYEDGEIDYARYTNFIARLAVQAEKHFHSKGSLMNREGIKPVAQALLIGARILNIDGASANTDVENLSAMLAEATGDFGVSIDSPSPWQRLKSSAHRSRAELRAALLSLISARQGTGEKIHALDSTQLLEAISDLRTKKWVLGEDPAAYLALPSQGVKEHLRLMRNLTPVTQRADEIIRWSETVTGAFGGNFDPSDLVANMRATVVESRDAGVFRCRLKQPPEFLPRLKDVTSLGTVRDHLTKAEKLRDNRDKFDIVLSTVAQVDDPLMERIATLITDYQLFLNETEVTVDDRLKDLPSDLEVTTSQLRAELELLAASWESMIDKP
ncbi:MAG: ATP-binding protein [Verrucomicrobiae bacterium]|nr:ATP-binding protein [Verrucomicrobiae bacterium]